MIVQAWTARLKACPLPQFESCQRHNCMLWRWDKSVKADTKFTTVNKDDFKGFCGLGGEPVSRAVIGEV